MEALLRWLTRRRQDRRELIELACHGLANVPIIAMHSDDDNAEAVNQMVELRVLVLRARRYSRRHSRLSALFNEAEAWLTSWLDTWAQNDLSRQNELTLYEHMVMRLESVASRISDTLKSEDRTP